MTIPKEDLDKRIVFTDTTKRQADFRIRLGYDGMTQSEFFRAMISGYLEQDRNLLDYIEKYKREKKRQVGGKVAACNHGGKTRGE